MKIVQTDKAPAAMGPYSQAIVVNGFVFCAGQVGRVPGTKDISPDIQEQTRQVIKNLEAVLREANSDLDHVVKTTIFLQNISDFSRVNMIYETYFSKNKPARSTVEVAKLPQGDLPIAPLVEIEAIAVLKL
jgi:2-iminobutanoate/2-iminopropanoate deaminase